jgi:hypothetical protein
MPPGLTLRDDCMAGGRRGHFAMPKNKFRDLAPSPRSEADGMFLAEKCIPRSPEKSESQIFWKRGETCLARPMKINALGLVAFF